MFLKFLEPILMFLIVAFLGYQVVYPWVRNRPAFPMFRRSTKLKNKLGEVQEEVENVVIEKQITKLEKKIN